MDADVTITISTGGSDAVSARAPVPGLTADTTAASLAGTARGPIPLPLDQLPVASGGGFSADTTGVDGPPTPAPVESLGAGIGRAADTAPMPMDLDRMTTATAGLPKPEDVEAMAAGSKGRGGARRRTRKADSG